MVKLKKGVAIILLLAATALLVYGHFTFTDNHIKAEKEKCNGRLEWGGDYCWCHEKKDYHTMITLDIPEEECW